MLQKSPPHKKMALGQAVFVAIEMSFEFYFKWIQIVSLVPKDKTLKLAKHYLQLSFGKGMSWKCCRKLSHFQGNFVFTGICVLVIT